MAKKRGIVNDGSGPVVVPDGRELLDVLLMGCLVVIATLGVTLFVCAVTWMATAVPWR